MKVTKTKVNPDFIPFNINLTIESTSDLKLIYCIYNHSYIQKALENTHTHEDAGNVFDAICELIKDRLFEEIKNQDELFDRFDNELNKLYEKSKS